MGGNSVLIWRRHYQIGTHDRQHCRAKRKEGKVFVGFGELSETEGVVEAFMVIIATHLTPSSPRLYHAQRAQLLLKLELPNPTCPMLNHARVQIGNNNINGCVTPNKTEPSIKATAWQFVATQTNYQRKS